MNLSTPKRNRFFPDFVYQVGAGCLLLLSLAVASAATSKDDENAPAQPPRPATGDMSAAQQHGAGAGQRNPAIKLKKGAKLYVDNCAICHGDNGNADTRAAGSLNPRPRDFTSIQSAMELSRERMIQSVSNGRPGTAMMAHKDRLTPEQIAEVVDFIRDNFMRTPSQVTIPENLKAGQNIYRKNCAVCHGDKGNTAIWARSGLNPPPRDFTSARARKELNRERMIHSVTNGRPGTGMMPFKSKLSASEIEQVVDFVRARFIRADMPHASEQPMSSSHPQMGGVAPAHPGGTAMLGQSKMPALGGKSNPHAGAGSHPGLPMLGMPSSRSSSMPISPPGFESMADADMSKPMPMGLKGDFNQGKLFFMNNCFTCHGVTGEGNGPRADFNIPRPRNFTSAESRRLFNRERLFNSVANGKVGTVMPAWSRVLTPQQIANVAEFVFQAFIQGKEIQNKGVQGKDASATAVDSKKKP